MTWARFERAALDTCDGWRVWLVWPQFLLEIAYLIAAPVHDLLLRLGDSLCGSTNRRPEPSG
jgi:hypothetical protein